MESRSLLERIAKPHPPHGEDKGDQALVLSIRRNLQRILNARHDTASAAPDYGTLDLSGMLRGPGALKALRAEIESAIQRYEPRLKHASVHFQPTDELFLIKFRVTADMVTDEGQVPAVFRTEINHSGKITISSSGE